ncbi:PepSY domain-containing protein [Rhodopseudomonas sp. B29]|uniref:PepSY-associated TM helix domain-containing protein n=1 Tax=Rhodopseudomonas sp. B29 TaxID=95607 RepID=UPI000687E21E|nr:PepSY-associated TM helix domain-containing protein [Rhodopseudomonas sp. B29]
MTRAALRKWFWVHKWTSLVCTAFLLLICVTGLPLVFSDEINDALDGALPYAAVPAGTPRVDLDHLITASRARYPGETVLFAALLDDEPKVIVTLAPSWAAFVADRHAVHRIQFDAHTGAVLKASDPNQDAGVRVTDVLLSLHRDLFAALPGELFLGLIGLLFVAAIVSGVVVYGPFMRRLDFATVRSERSSRVKWLDLHNLLGIVPLMWMLVVGATGVVNELSTPLFGLWQITDVKAMLAPMAGKPVPQQLSSPQAAIDVARAAAPEMVPTSVVFPGSPFGSPYHYLIWTKGRSALTSRLFSPILVDARDGKLAAVVMMPWYLRVLEVSRPLHFGDYGGWPLKIIWCLLDIVTIAVLGSGLYLWFGRRRLPPEFSEVEADLADSRVSGPLVERAAE